jgi:hypothetical protein
VYALQLGEESHEAAEVAGRSGPAGLKLSTLRDWRLKQKYLDFVEIGRAVAVTEESLERLIQANLIPAREGR